jgi:hypothetical protein
MIPDTFDRPTKAAKTKVVIKKACECEPQQVSAGDVVIISSLCPQRITNIGAEDLVF